MCAGLKPQVCVCVHTLVPTVYVCVSGCLYFCFDVSRFKPGGHASVHVYACVCVSTGVRICDWLSGLSVCVFNCLHVSLMCVM